MQGRICPKYLQMPELLTGQLIGHQEGSLQPACPLRATLSSLQEPENIFVQTFDFWGCRRKDWEQDCAPSPFAVGCAGAGGLAVRTEGIVRARWNCSFCAAHKHF